MNWIGFVFFMVWLTNERHLAFFPVGSIVSDLHHCESWNLRHAASRTWTCAEPEFRLSWMKLCSSDNHYTALSVSTSADGKSWERQDCCFVIQRSLCLLKLNIYIYITLPNSRNSFDVIFTKWNALRRHLLQTGTIQNW